MATKFLISFVVAVVLIQGLTAELVEINLPEETHSLQSNSLLGKTVTIPKSFLDTLENCYVIFPNGNVIEAYPNNQITVPGIFFLEAAQPFVSCGIGFRGTDASYTGTYELMSLVHHRAEGYYSMTRLRFHITIN